MSQDDRRIDDVDADDHRRRVAAERRARMRDRLVESALIVFSQHGLDTRVVGRIIEQAGVSRGTFYHYFRTDQDLFQAVAVQVSDEIITLLDPLVLQHSHPAARVATGVRLAIDLAAQYPLLAEFLDRGGPAALLSGPLVNQSVPRDLQLGLSTGCFKTPTLELALDVVLGPVQMAFRRIVVGPTAQDYPAAVAHAILLGLGVPAEDAGAFVALPLEPLELAEASLLFRASKVAGTGR